ncbi:hypothetical protein [Rhizorhabdus dicambivorans]|uniref:hypothetical protein n=1 Tax=Rhizorhabdus dicambivorans TaxID=1850238 RepID=UPI0012906D5E|nr:hypothetical protein [Rhizorhabdus dicambivorans]
MGDREGWSDRGGLLGRGLLVEGDTPGSYKSTIGRNDHDERSDFVRWVRESPSAQRRIAAGDAGFIQWARERSKPVAPREPELVRLFRESKKSATSASPAHVKMERKMPDQSGGLAETVVDMAGKVWNSPNTAIGLAAALPSYVAGKVMGTDPKFRFGNNALQLLNSPLNIDGRAYTVGNIQIYAPGYGPERDNPDSYTGQQVNNGLHEEGHTYQGQVLGPLYIPLEIAGTYLGDDNPFDIDADNYAVRKQKERAAR